MAGGEQHQKIARHEDGEDEELRTSYGGAIRVFFSYSGSKSQKRPFTWVDIRPRLVCSV